MDGASEKEYSPMFSSRKSTSAALLAAGTLLTTIALAGCGNSDSQTPPTTVVSTPPPSTVVTTPSPGTVVSTNPPGPNTKLNVNAGPGTSLGTDPPTADAVNKAIVTNKEMTGARVEAVVTDGVATLTGTVQNQQQKALAEKAATDTTGVTSVKNKLQITPTGGAKSASKPSVTKVIVVHKTVTVPGPAPTGPPPADTTGTGDGTPSGTSPVPPTDGTTDGGTAPASGGTPAPPPPSSGQ
jgi:hypothetical protein